MNYRLVAPMLLVAAACTRPEPRPRDTDSPTSDSDTTTPPSETAHTGVVTETASTGITGDTAPETVEIDCATDVPAGPVSMMPIVGGRAYHGVTFDDVGNVIGSEGNHLVWADYYGNAGILVPNVGTVQGLARLHDGDFVASSSSNGALMRFTSAGALAPITGDSGAYGVVVGHDGMIYTANYSIVERVDPATGARTELLDPNAFSPKTLNWNRDHTKMFFGTSSGNGDVYVVDTDPVTLDIIGSPTVFATGVGAGQYHDCLTVDYCDNVYVCDFNTQKLYRITPNGSVSVYISYPAGMYSHGAEWGSGINGFRVDALYIAQPYNDNHLAEVVVGIPGRAWDGTGWTPPP